MSLSQSIVTLFGILLFAVVVIALLSLSLEKLRSYPPDKATLRQIRTRERLLSFFSHLAVIVGAVAAVLIVILMLVN